MASQVSAQVGISTDYSQPDNSAMLDVKSSNKGLLVPRLTLTRISSIIAPANDLIVYCTSHKKFYAFLASTNAWQEFMYGPGLILPPSLPTVTTNTVTNITTNNKTSGGNVISDGGAPVTAYGVCWRTGVNPTLSDNLTTDGTETGVFVSYLAGLYPNSQYNLRAYATTVKEPYRITGPLNGKNRSSWIVRPILQFGHWSGS